MTPPDQQDVVAYLARVQDHARLRRCICTMRQDGTGQQCIGPWSTLHVIDLSLSPDGQTVAFTCVDMCSSDNHRTHLYLMHSAGGDLQRVRTGDSIGYPRDVAWSPDGKHLAVTMEHVGAGLQVSRLYMMSPDGSHREQLTGNEEWVWSVTWSPDGTHLAYTANRQTEPGGTQRVRVLDLDRVRSGTVMESPDRYVVSLDWSPSGTELLFLTWEPHQAESLTRMMVACIDGTHHRKIIDSPTVATPRWTASGEQILFADRRAGNYNIYIVNHDGSHEHQLTHGDHDTFSPSPARASRL